MKVSADAGRKSVRSIFQYPILSAEWVMLVDHLKNLSRLVQIEGRMPANAKVAEARGRNSESGGTLWDQEAHENAIRILVEEAKVNLCLRMINDYKKWCYEPAARQAAIQRAAGVFGHSEAQLEQICCQYEECLGMLLERAFDHVETLQLIDIPLLLEHIFFVLDYSLKRGVEPVNPKMQEFVVLFYFSSVMRHSEALKNPELLPKSREFRLPQLAVDHILTHGEQYHPEMTMTVLEGLSAMSDNEDFQTDWEDFFDTPQSRQQFLAVEERVVSPLLSAQPNVRRELRPLLDMFNKVKKAR